LRLQDRHHYSVVCALIKRAGQPLAGDRKHRVGDSSCSPFSWRSHPPSLFGSLSRPEKPVEEGFVSNLLKPIAHPSIETSAPAKLEREVAIADQAKRTSAVVATSHGTPSGAVIGCSTSAGPVGCKDLWRQAHRMRSKFGSAPQLALVGRYYASVSVVCIAAAWNRHFSCRRAGRIGRVTLITDRRCDRP
jgi:hypothetical protein